LGFVNRGAYFRRNRTTKGEFRPEGATFIGKLSKSTSIFAAAFAALSSSLSSCLLRSFISCFIYYFANKDALANSCSNIAAAAKYSLCKSFFSALSSSSKAALSIRQKNTHQTIVAANVQLLL